MTRMPKYSVVIPIYNSHPYIRATLDSVLTQAEQDFEVIVVDDGSPNPEGAEIVRTYTDPRVRLVVQENKGLPGARNRGIQEAKGEYVALLDGDDIWYPFHLQGATDFFCRYPQVGWYTAHLVEVEFGQSVPEMNYSHRFTIRQPYDGVSPGHSSAMVVRRDLFLKSGGFPEKFVQGQEDRIAYAKLAKIMPLTGVLQGVSVVYMKHPGSITKTAGHQYDFEFWEEVLAALLPIGLYPGRKNNSSVREVVEFMLRVGFLTRQQDELLNLMKSVRHAYTFLSYWANICVIRCCGKLICNDKRVGTKYRAYVEAYPRMAWKARFVFLINLGGLFHKETAALWVFTVMSLFARIVGLCEDKRMRMVEKNNTHSILKEFVRARM